MKRNEQKKSDNRFRVLLTLLIISIISTLSGCINYEEKLKLNLDGSGKMKIHYWTDMKNIGFFDSAKSTISFDEKVIQENFKNENIKITSSKIYHESDYKHFEIELEFKNILDLNSIKFFEDKPFSYEDGASGQKILNRKISSIGKGSDELQKYEFIFDYELPGKIVTDNSMLRNGNVLKWNFKLSELKEPKTLSMTIRTTEGSNSFIYIMILLIIIVLVVLIVLRRRKLINEKK